MNESKIKNEEKDTIEIIKERIQTSSNRQKRIGMDQITDKRIANDLLTSVYAKKIKEGHESGDRLNKREIKDLLDKLVKEAIEIHNL